MTSTYEQDAENMRNSTCPVCHHTFGPVNSRHLLLNHIKRVKEPEHVLWRTLNYGKHMKRGKYAKNKEVTPEQLKQAIKKEFGLNIIIES
jgi:hypothetical protein